MGIYDGAPSTSRSSYYLFYIITIIQWTSLAIPWNSIDLKCLAFECYDIVTPDFEIESLFFEAPKNTSLTAFLNFAENSA